MQLGLGPVVGHPGPCGIVAEDQPDALKGQLAEYPEAEHLFVRLVQRVQALMYSECRILIDQQLGNVRSVGGGGFGIFQRGSVLCPAAVGIVGVAGHREQPRPYILPVVVVLQTVQCLEEGFLRQLLGQRFVVGQALQDRSRKAHKWLYFPL